MKMQPFGDLSNYDNQGHVQIQIESATIKLKIYELMKAKTNILCSFR